MRGAWWVVAAVLAWFAAFQVKEVAVWCTPVWLYAVLGDLRAHGGRWVLHRFGPAVAIGLVLIAATSRSARRCGAIRWPGCTASTRPR